MKVIHLGLIGASKGNGHPYSWSAIINGYDKKKMKHCEYKVIPNYLKKKQWPKDYIKNAKVTHIWTQNFNLSKKIASTTFIPNVVTNLKLMIGKVDGVLLARDDYVNHYKLARPFLLAGIPIYIDKPISITQKNLKKIYSKEIYQGQIFTCSATRYSKNLSLNKNALRKLGKIKIIDAQTPKSWDKYGIHVIEPVLKMLAKNDRVSKFIICTKKKISILWKSKIITNFNILKSINSKISIVVTGEKGQVKLVFEDTFDSFKNALKDFIYGIRKKTIKSNKKFNFKVVSIIEQGVI